ncbi:MAG TPA: hypothetical protein VHB21_10370, partial [Minicystis sp.]|nr:hypothetical protein [Minicystis sp.]
EAQPSSADAAHADPKADFAAARTRFAIKDYKGALPLFQRALAASGSPNAALYVGLCLKGLRRPIEAYEAMTVAARESANKMATDASYRHTNDVAKQTLAELQKKIGLVTVTVSGAPVGVHVTVNGAPLPDERLGTPWPVPPGKVSVVAAAAGVADQRADVVVAAGADKAVPLVFAAHGSELAAASPAPAAPEAPSRGMTPMRKTGIAVAGMGVVGLGVFALAGLMANADYDNVKRQCGGRCTGTKFQSDIDRGRTLDTLANVGLVVGVAGVAGGGVLFALGGRKTERDASLSIGPGRVAIEGRF